MAREAMIRHCWFGGSTVAEYQYDTLSRRTLLTYGNDANIAYQYDIANHLTKISNNISETEKITFEYSLYDRVGNRLKSKKTEDGSTTDTYQYDNLYQLKSVNYHGEASGYYDYDKAGNRTGALYQGGHLTKYERNWLNQYTTVDVNFNEGENEKIYSYAYDANGNLTSDGVYTYIYDCENRLLQVKQGVNTVATYKYDFAGRRVSKTVGGTTTTFVYDGDEIIADNVGYLSDIIIERGKKSPISNHSAITTRSRRGKTLLCFKHLRRFSTSQASEESS